MKKPIGWTMRREPPKLHADYSYKEKKKAVSFKEWITARV